MKYFLSFLIIIVSLSARAQSVPCVEPKLVVYTSAGDTIPNDGTDTLQCGNSCVTMHAAIDSNYLLGTTTYSVTAVTYAPQSFTAGTNVTYLGAVMATSGLTDDAFGDVIDLPFNFCFFGVSYNKIVVGSNGNASFNTGVAGAYDPWPISSPLPTSNCTATYNCIMAPWNDMQDYAAPGATVTYAVYGVAPCRQFVVSWNDDQLYTPGICTGLTSTQQFIMYETTNVIDIYIAHRVPCTGWNNGFAVTGIENAAGSVFYTAPGENATTFTATDEGWRFTPATPVIWNYSWMDSTGAVIGSTDSLLICPTVNTSRYSVMANDPSTCVVTVYDSFTIYKENGLGIDSSWFTNPTSCIAYDGSIVFHGIPPGDTIYLSYDYNGTPSGTLVRYPDADSNIVFSGLPSGVYADFILHHDSCLIGPYTFTLVAPPIEISHETFVNPTICGDNNGSITLYGLLPGEPVTIDYLAAYSFPARTIDTLYTGTVSSDSTVTISNLPAGVYSGFIAHIGSCTANGTSITITNPPPIPASFTLANTLHCNSIGDVVTVTNTSTPEPNYNAYFAFGDGTPVDSSNAIPLSHSYNDDPTNHIATYTIKLTYEGYGNPGCLSTFSIVDSFNHPITASYVMNADTVCLGTSIQFTGSTVSEANPTYTWNYGDGSAAVTSGAALANYNYAYGGTFTPTLTVTDSLGCDTSYSGEPIYVINFNVHLGINDTNVCLVDSMPLVATAVTNFPFVGWNYSWMPTNNIGLDSTYTSPGVLTSTSVTNFYGVGIYSYTVTATTTLPLMALNPNGCVSTDTEDIVSYPPVTLTQVTASPVTVNVGSSAYLNASGAVYYSWIPDNGTLSNANINDPMVTPVDSSTIYTVYGMNQYGCKDSATVVVLVNNTTYQGVPSAFTPNGDGLNDVFKVTPLKSQKLVEMRIYNRWGQAVFYTANPNIGWDGTFNGVPQDMGTYAYEIIVAVPEGGNLVYKGTVTLIR